MHLIIVLALYLAACGKSFADSGVARSLAKSETMTNTSTALSPARATDAPHAACALAATPKAAPTNRTVMTCTWKSSCLEGGWIALGQGINTATIKVTGQSDGKTYTGVYDDQSGQLNFAATTCPERGSTFVVQFEVAQPTAIAMSSDTIVSSSPAITLTAITISNSLIGEKLFLYANPCTHHTATVTSCEAGAPLTDLDSEVPSCASLNLELGDVCPEGLEKCERQAAQACDTTPTKIIFPATYLYCRGEPFDESACGRSSN